MRNFFKTLPTRASLFGLCTLLLALAAAGCGDEEPPTAPTPPPLVTETFTGTINRNGAASHRFTATSGGQLSATLTNLSPDDTITVGFGVGFWNGTACDLSRGLVRDEAAKAAIIYANVNATGELCVRIYDVGRLEQSTDYEITVTHP